MKCTLEGVRAGRWAVWRHPTGPALPSAACGLGSGRRKNRSGRTCRGKGHSNPTHAGRSTGSWAGGEAPRKTAFPCIQHSGLWLSGAGTESGHSITVAGAASEWVCRKVQTGTDFPFNPFPGMGRGHLVRGGESYQYHRRRSNEIGFCGGGRSLV